MTGMHLEWSAGWGFPGWYRIRVATFTVPFPAHSVNIPAACARTQVCMARRGQPAWSRKETELREGLHHAHWWSRGVSRSERASRFCC